MSTYMRLIFLHLTVAGSLVTLLVTNSMPKNKPMPLKIFKKIKVSEKNLHRFFGYL